MNPKREIVEKIGQAAVLEQLAEEAAELAQSALKMARIIRGENLTPVTAASAFDSLFEEVGDVRLCISVMEEMYGGFDTKEPEEKKLLRWQNRLNDFHGGGGAVMPPVEETKNEV